MNDVPLYPKPIDDQRVLNSNLPHSCKAVSTIRAPVLDSEMVNLASRYSTLSRFSDEELIEASFLHSMQQR